MGHWCPRDRSGKALFRKFCVRNKELTVTKFAEKGLSGSISRMPTVLRVEAYRFFFVSLDRSEPPHIHVKREKKVAKFWLDPVVLERAGGFSRSEVNMILTL